MRPIPAPCRKSSGRLQENGVSAERKSIYDDMEVLRSFGMDIKFKRGKSTGYYVTGRSSDRSAGRCVYGKSANPQTAAVEIARSRRCGRDASGTEELRPDWLLPFSDSEDDKPVKLLYSSKRKE
ncbi:MAG: hypothetical protein ACLU6Y_04275 [Ruminococcus sp.]